MIIPVNKPAGMTSFDVVAKMRRIMKTKQVGHTGTLDPIATGVLVILTGGSCRAAEYITAGRKKYRAVMLLGKTSLTQDITGEISAETPFNGGFSDVEMALPEFTGDIMQVPPMYSALKRNGVKLCDAARRGEKVELEPRPVTVYSLTAEKTDAENEFVLNVECSAGTYIRTLCNDIGERLGCGGLMKELTRTETGGFTLGECFTLEQLAGMSGEELSSVGYGTEQILSDFEMLKLPDFFETLYGNGCAINLKKIGKEGKYVEGQLLRVYGEDGFFSVGKIIPTDDGPAVKTEKFFRE